MGSIKITVDRIQPGLHIRLPVKWNEHPFLFNSFKIKDLRQLEGNGKNVMHLAASFSDKRMVNKKRLPSRTSRRVTRSRYSTKTTS